VVPPERHIVGGSQQYQNIVENFFMRLRAWLARMVRKTVSFSKNLFNHVAALTIVINDLNKSFY
jgi:IS1 family transposase